MFFIKLSAADPKEGCVIGKSAITQITTLNDDSDCSKNNNNNDSNDDNDDDDNNNNNNNNNNNDNNDDDNNNNATTDNVVDYYSIDVCARPPFVCTARTQISARVKNAISTCRKGVVGLTAGVIMCLIRIYVQKMLSHFLLN